MDKIKLFFNPKSVALVGATDKEGSTGKIILQNLIKGKDRRAVYPVNPNRESVLEQKCYPALKDLPEVPELVLVVVPAKFVPQVIEDAGKVGTKSVIIISAGFKEVGPEGKALEEKIAEIAKQYGIRIIGPNCMGTMSPASGFNATFARMEMPKPGNVAFLSQSGALGSAVLDWAIARNVGFSGFASIGSMMDVNFGDLIDYFGTDENTKSIIVYLETMGEAKKFMSAARGFARTKPIIVIKPGRFEESAQAAKSHTGSMVGNAMFVDAIFQRAGVVRVDNIGDLFSCAAILNTSNLPKGPNLAIVTNAGGPAVLATDSLMEQKGKLAHITDETVTALNPVLPPSWSKGNPMDILGDADPERYAVTLEAAIKDPGVDGVVVIYTPQGAANPLDIAKTIVKIAKKSKKPVLTSWMGDANVAEARKLFYQNNIPSFEFPEEAVKGYIFMYRYARGLENLYETPEELAVDVDPSKEYIRTILKKVASEGRTLLSETESKKFLQAYGIDATVPFLARDGKDAAQIASALRFPVVMKIASPDISHKSDVGGVILGLKTEAEVEKAFATMMENVKAACPEASIEGVTLQRMVDKYDYELIIGSKKDPVFGPVILFGSGGIEAEFQKDVAVGLPPLNQVLARRVMEGTKIYEMLYKGFRTKPPANLRLLEETLVKFSNLLVDFPEIMEIDINPLALLGSEAIALDARIIIDEEYIKNPAGDHNHLIITPYPAKYIKPWHTKDGRDVILRPIRPEDEPMEKALLEGLSEESSRMRFFHILKDINHSLLVRFCNIDYDREMAIIAEYNDKGKKRNVGVGRLIIDHSGQSGEFSVLVADDFQHHELGAKLLDMLIGIGREKGLRNLYGVVLAENVVMLNLCKDFGFNIKKDKSTEYKVNMEL
ncbi:GNAT family N-acetyltransferase [Dehalococcoides sp. THU4]|uniref:bifunctional acetate--CoA ligase family protein/GNAT family N-acetyltransferase n=1 Tax=Dehalococcoides sp. THU4 TaxID=3348344 RepID=UPI00371692AE